MSDPQSSQILDVLARVAETDEVRSQSDLALYDLQVLDSMKTVELIVALEAGDWRASCARGIRARSLGHAARNS